MTYCKRYNISIFKPFYFSLSLSYSSHCRRNLCIFSFEWSWKIPVPVATLLKSVENDKFKMIRNNLWKNLSYPISKILTQCHDIYFGTKAFKVCEIYLKSFPKLYNLFVVFFFSSVWYCNFLSNVYALVSSFLRFVIFFFLGAAVIYSFIFILTYLFSHLLSWKF